MTRVSSFDIDKKKAGEIVKYTIDDLSKYCNDIYFLLIGNVDENFLSWLRINKIITISSKNYNEGWAFDNYTSLNDLYLTVNKHYDWIVYPDSDDILPPQLLEELWIAEEQKADILEIPILECINGYEEVIGDFSNYIIGPHAKALKPAPDITFLGSDGFAKPVSSQKRRLKSYHSPYPMRHLRYVTQELRDARKSINYYQEYFSIPKKTTKYNPLWTFQQYLDEGRKYE